MSTNLGMPGDHACTCGEHGEADLPVLVASDIPHAIRHAAVFGAIEGSPRGIQLVAPHDPLPLLAQIEQRWPDTYDITYVERDTAWRINITPRAHSAVSA